MISMKPKMDDSLTENHFGNVYCEFFKVCMCTSFSSNKYRYSKHRRNGVESCERYLFRANFSFQSLFPFDKIKAKIEKECEVLFSDRKESQIIAMQLYQKPL